MPDQTVTAALAAYTSAYERLLEQLLAIVGRLVTGFTGWYNDDAVAGLADVLTGQAEAAQTHAAALTNAYLSAVTSDLTGRIVPPAPASVDPATLRAGVAHSTVYGRLAENFRYLEATGTNAAEAARRVTTRAEVLADTDMQLAARGQAHLFVVSTEHVTGWRRVVRPELSKGGTCGLCVVASDRRYTREDLMPIHARCRCAVMPIVGAHDPGVRLNKADLGALYTAAGSTRAEDLKRTRVAVRQHGELGPVLTDASDDFRGPADVPAA